MIVVLKGLLLPSSPFGPDHFRSWPGPLLTGGAATAGALPDRSAKNLRIGRTLKCRLPLQALSFSNLSIFVGLGGRFYHATGPCFGRASFSWRTTTCHRRGARRRRSGGSRSRRPRVITGTDRTRVGEMTIERLERVPVLSNHQSELWPSPDRVRRRA